MGRRRGCDEHNRIQRGWVRWWQRWLGLEASRWWLWNNWFLFAVIDGIGLLWIEHMMVMIAWVRNCRFGYCWCRGIGAAMVDFG
jgi:hypothetical protein